VDRAGNLQTQAPFKGSYEVGAALWSLALHRESGWLDRGVPSANRRDCLRALVKQAVLPADQGGFYDPQRGLWIHALSWSHGDWVDWEEHDWKYALHMEEGALEYLIADGGRELLVPTRRELEYLLASTQRDGSVKGMVATKSDIEYEYGLALSVLALASDAFRRIDGDLADRCLIAGARVFAFASKEFEPESSEEHAVLLTGMARVVLALDAN